MNKEEILSHIKEIYNQIQQEKLNDPNQYVVGYFRKDNDELIGYHLSTFCQLTNDILQAKRYVGDNPYSQINIISKNLKALFTNNDNNDSFKEIYDQIKSSYYESYNYEDIYLDAIYVTPGTTLPECNLNIM